jgi:arylsulfatase A-like enzyme
MKSKWRLPLIVVLVAVGLGGFLIYLRSKPQVNLLLITLDTTRADRLGCYGYKLALTPQLDALAKNGVLFERAYAPAPMTSPSHTSIMTGLWPPEHGVHTNASTVLDPNIPTIAELLQKRGYATAAFPAASMLAARFGLNRGFQSYFDDLSDPKTGADRKQRSRDGRYIADLSIQWLKQRQQADDAPFFCWLHFYDPHDPYHIHPEEFDAKFRDRPYDAELAYVDRQIGRVIDELERLGELENTIIVIAGDHGESLGEHGEDMHGYLLHESTLRVPMIVANYAQAKAGHRVATPVSLIDLFPTLLEISGAEVPGDLTLRSLQPALLGNPLAPRLCYSQTVEPYLQAFWSPLQSLTNERWRYVRTTQPELYDLTADPQELVNLASQQPDRVSELDGELTAFEEKFQIRTGKQVTLSAQEQRALESLGYAGGSSAKEDPRHASDRPDVKDMISYLNQFNRAVHLIDDRNFDEAAILLEPLARDVPNFHRARLNLAQCRIAQEQYTDAIHWCQAALEIDPDSARGYEMMGYSQLKLRELGLAEKSFLRQLELQPESENGHLYLAEVYQRQEKFPLAMQHYENVLRINPRNEAALRVLEAMRAAFGSQPN